jgi:starch synthase
MKILYISSESSPFVKTGGLGDVGSSLPRKLNELKVQTDVFIPQFQEVLNSIYYRDPVLYSTGFILLKRNRISYEIFTLYFNNIRYYFVNIPTYFHRNKGIYNYFDDYERFAAFSLVAVDFLEKEKYSIAHCNDWHSGLIPFFLKQNNSSIRSVFNIHHMKYQGKFSKTKYKKLKISMPHQTQVKKLGLIKKINYLQAGIDYADIIALDSDSYKKEVLTTPLGYGLQERLKLRLENLYAIRNGIDYHVFNPKSDKDICFNYDEHNFIQGKAKNKACLQQALNLPPNKGPIIAMITRIVEQKGFSIVKPIIENLVSMFDFQFVLLGSGDKKIEYFYQKLQRRYPDNIVFHPFSTKLANQVYASSDILLMPSQFEPCGLSQLIAIKYGTIPIVRDTGGLSDTINESYGFKFLNYNSKELKHTVIKAIEAFQNKQSWNTLIENAMVQDFSWDINALKYIDLYHQIS